MKKIIAAIVLFATTSTAVFITTANAQIRGHAPASRGFVTVRPPSPPSWGWGGGWGSGGWGSWGWGSGFGSPRVIVTSGFWPSYSIWGTPVVTSPAFVTPVSSNAAGGAILGGVLGGIIGRGTGYRNGWAGALIGSTIGMMAGAAADNAAINNQNAVASQQQTTNYDCAAPAAQQPQPAPVQTPAQPQQPTVINNYYGAGNTSNTPMGQANALFGRQ